MMRGRSTDWRRFSSSVNEAWPAAVIRTLSIVFVLRSRMLWKACTQLLSDRALVPANTALKPTSPCEGPCNIHTWRRVPAILALLPIAEGALPPGQRSVVGKVTLKGADLKVSVEIGTDTLGCRLRPRKSGVIGHFMQEGSPPQRAAIGQRLWPFGGVEHQLDLAIGDGVDDVRPALQHLVHLVGRNAVVAEVALGSGGGHHLETERMQQPHRVRDAHLVVAAPR